MDGRSHCSVWVNRLYSMLSEKLQQRAADLLRKSYSVVTLSHFAQALNMSPSEALSAATDLGWSHNEANGSLTRMPTQDGTRQVNQGVSQLTLQQISTTIQQLEHK
eukprot:m.25823 g.25823  ORF g.25823 m.25823 type:complete len:106 (+) comp4269_c0_seq1:2-319(+)